MENKFNFKDIITYLKPFLFYPTIMLLSIATIFFAFLFHQVSQQLNTIYYINAELCSGTVYSFKNSDDLKMIKINDDIYVSDIKSLPPFVENNDVVRVAIDNNGHILKSETYKIEGVIYSNGYKTNTNKIEKEVSYDEYQSLISKTGNTNLQIVKSCYLMFIVLFITIIIFLANNKLKKRKL